MRAAVLDAVFGMCLNVIVVEPDDPAPPGCVLWRLPDDDFPITDRTIWTADGPFNPPEPA